MTSHTQKETFLKETTTDGGYDSNKAMTDSHQDKRRVWQRTKAFSSACRLDWLNVDDTVLAVLQSIANLRHRIHLESKHLSCLDKKKNNKSVLGLLREDVEMALDHDLLVHEDMMRALRKQAALLSQGQDALGRRLEQVMETSRLQDNVMNDAVASLNQLYIVLAKELYRKQSLVQGVLDSCHDGLLYRNECRGGDIQTQTPTSVAEDCVKDWPRGCKRSFVDNKWLDEVLSLGDAD